MDRRGPKKDESIELMRSDRLAEQRVAATTRREAKKRQRTRVGGDQHVTAASE